MSAWIKYLPFGWLKPFDDNELHHHSTKMDPPKYRMSVNASDIRVGESNNLGFFSFNTMRDGYVDSAGQEELDEWALIGPRIVIGPDGKKFGAIAFCARHEDEQDAREVMLVAPHGVWFNQPLRNIPTPPPALLRAPGGQTELHMQGDGNVVAYDVRPQATLDGVKKWVPLATLKDGKLREFREDGRYTS